MASGLLAGLAGGAKGASEGMLMKLQMLMQEREREQKKTDALEYLREQMSLSGQLAEEGRTFTAEQNNLNRTTTAKTDLAALLAALGGEIDAEGPGGAAAARAIAGAGESIRGSASLDDLLKAESAIGGQASRLKRKRVDKETVETREHELELARMRNEALMSRLRAGQDDDDQGLTQATVRGIVNATVQDLTQELEDLSSYMLDLKPQVMGGIGGRSAPGSLFSPIGKEHQRKQARYKLLSSQEGMNKAVEDEVGRRLAVVRGNYDPDGVDTGDPRQGVDAEGFSKLERKIMQRMLGDILSESETEESLVQKFGQIAVIGPDRARELVRQVKEELR